MPNKNVAGKLHANAQPPARFVLKTDAIAAISSGGDEVLGCFARHTGESYGEGAQGMGVVVQVHDSFSRHHSEKNKITDSDWAVAGASADGG